MANATITGTASNFGSISGVLAGEAGTVAGTITGTVSGTLTGSVGVPGAGVPSGGTTGQVLKKVSNTDYDTTWGTDLASAAWGTITGTITDQTDLTAYVAAQLAGGTAVAKNLEVYVRNQSGATLTAGTIVYIDGATGNRPTVTKAQANNDANSAQTFGFIKENIANNGFGYVIVRGELENVDTSALTEGQQLYLSPTTAGTWTTTKPSAPQHLVYVGICIRAHPTQGIILVAIQNGYELNELHDVKITSVSNGQVLKYDSAQGLWVNGTDSSGVAWGGITGTLSNQTDLQTALDAKATAADFLSKAGNLSGLADLATSRTNLGLGTMAVETASNYLTTSAASSTYAALSSPALNGTPTAPTASAGTNTTQIATTAFVQQEVPAASTTAAGKVELATNAEVITTNSTSFVPSLDNIPAILSRPENRSFSYLSYTAVSGNGAVSGPSYGLREMYLNTLSTGRAAFLYGIPAVNQAVPLMSRANNQLIDFSKKMWLTGKTCAGFNIATNYMGDSNTMCRITLGGYNANGTGDMTNKGIGWKKAGGTSSYFTLTVHNGTTLTDVATTVQQSDKKVIDWVIYSDGTGNVTLYIDGAQAATTTAGPTGTTTAGWSFYREQVEATATPTVRQIMHSTGGNLYIEG